MPWPRSSTASTPGPTGPIRLQNPSNPKEWITDRWNEKPEMYDAFIAEVFDLRVRWHKLIEKGQFPDIITG